MEHSHPVYEAHHPAQRVSAAPTSPYASTYSTPWGNAENSPALPTLAAQIDELLGAHSEPDSQFFVESWTLGAETAAQRFQARREAATHRDFDPSTFRSFDFSVPLNFVPNPIQDGSPHKQSFASMPAGFSTAWKSAYGVQGAPASRDTNQSRDEGSSNPRMPSQPLTLEDACRTLGVAQTSTRKQIKAAYRQLVWQYHPDRFVQSSEQDRRVATEKMTSINEAYHLLCSSELAAAS